MTHALKAFPLWVFRRPTNRKYIKIGDTLILIAKIGTGYYVKD